MYIYFNKKRNYITFHVNSTCRYNDFANLIWFKNCSSNLNLKYPASFIASKFNFYFTCLNFKFQFRISLYRWFSTTKNRNNWCTTRTLSPCFSSWGYTCQRMWDWCFPEFLTFGPFRIWLRRLASLVISPLVDIKFYIYLKTKLMQEIQRNSLRWIGSLVHKTLNESSRYNYWKNKEIFTLDSFLLGLKARN